MLAEAMILFVTMGAPDHVVVEPGGCACETVSGYAPEHDLATALLCSAPIPDELPGCPTCAVHPKVLSTAFPEHTAPVTATLNLSEAKNGECPETGTACVDDQFCKWKFSVTGTNTSAGTTYQMTLEWGDVGGTLTTLTTFVIPKSGAGGHGKITTAIFSKQLGCGHLNKVLRLTGNNQTSNIEFSCGACASGTGGAPGN